MTTYNPASTMGTIVPIVGMGIGLGLLAHTARGVTDTMYGPRRQHIARPRPRPKQRTYQSHYNRPYNPRPYNSRHRRW